MAEREEVEAAYDVHFEDLERHEDGGGHAGDDVDDDEEREGHLEMMEDGDDDDEGEEDADMDGDGGFGGRDRLDPGAERFHSDSEYEDDDEDEMSDTTAADAARGKDLQGIPWHRLHFSRQKYRETRLLQYKNYENLNVPHDLVEQDCKPYTKGGRYFDFWYNTRLVKSTIVHFQLRNLVWATTKHDVYVMHHYAVNHWSPIKRKSTVVLDLIGSVTATPPGQTVNRVQVSTMCAAQGLLVAGGFHGEMVCKSLQAPGVQYCARITHDENAITNAIDIYSSESGATRIMSSNNDSIVRVFDAATFRTLHRFYFSWPVNHTSVSPDGRTVLVVGDDPLGFLADAQSGKVIANLHGHLDYSFASAWHPDGRMFATGNQDTTCQIWDVRQLRTSLMALKGRIGAIRSIRFSADGRFMAMAEPADFVHVFDTQRDFARSQEIDLFGEIAGISFSPDSEAFFVGVADRTYGSLLEYNLRHQYEYLDSLF